MLTGDENLSLHKAFSYAIPVRRDASFSQGKSGIQSPHLVSIHTERQDEILASYSGFSVVTLVLAPHSAFSAEVEKGPQIILWCLLETDSF